MTKAWILPTVIDPPETVCVQIEVPKDDLHIAAFFGAIQALGYWWNWERDDLQSGLAASLVWQRQLDLVADTLGSGESCMIDCAEVEDCLETSSIINVIEGDIITNEGDIIQNETNITNIYEGDLDNNVYPPAPTTSEPDALCGASYRIAQGIIDLVEQSVIDIDTQIEEVYLLAQLAGGSFLAVLLTAFFNYINDNQVALDGVDFDQYLDEIATAFYCAELDRTLAESELDPTITTLHRDAIISGMRAPTDGQISLWAFVGSLDDTQDCDDICSWCITHNWAGGGANGWVKVPDSQGAGIFSGSGIAHEDIQPGDARRTVYIQREFTSSELTQIDLVLDFTKGTFEGNDLTLSYVLTDGIDATTVLTKFRDTMPEGSSITIPWDDPAGETADQINIFLRSSVDTSVPYAYSGNIECKSVEICGLPPTPGDL